MSGIIGANLVAGRSSGQIAAVAAAAAGLTQSAVQTPTSGTTVDFTGIPSGVIELMVNFNRLDSDGTGDWKIFLGDSGGFETSGYYSAGYTISGSSTHTQDNRDPGDYVKMCNVSNNTWEVLGSVHFHLADDGTNAWSVGVLCGVAGAVTYSAGTKLLSGELTQVRVEAPGDFVAGSVSILHG